MIFIFLVCDSQRVIGVLVNLSVKSKVSFGSLLIGKRYLLVSYDSGFLYTSVD